MDYNISSSYVYLRNLRFKAYHGVMEQERIAGNDYVVNLRIKYPMEQAMLSDDVEDTLNYANVFEIISQEMSVPSNLLERVAYRICDRLFRKYTSIEALDIDLRKENPPMGADCDGAGVELHLINKR
jgi:dihydroneopterin aldolase